MNDSQTILLVDDSADDIFLVRSAFRNAQVPNPIQEAHNGDEAIAYLQGKAPFNDRTRFPLPALMLLDLNMPMRNGFEVLEWLRAQPGLKRLTVVILTSSLREEDVDRAFDLGANSFLVKPSSIEDLTAVGRTLRDWLGCTRLPQLAESVRH
ncbi:MAG TPA: response regulator [Verrucomicrobiae bacterium]